MTTTSSVLYTDVGVLNKPYIFQSRSLLIIIYDILKNDIFTCSCWASVENGLLWRWSAIQWFEIHHKTATIQNSAIYLLGARVSILRHLFPD